MNLTFGKQTEERVKTLAKANDQSVTAYLTGLINEEYKLSLELGIIDPVKVKHEREEAER